MAGEAQLPGNQAYAFEKFGSLNTKSAREAIGDDEFSWCENWMPIGDGNLRTLYDKGATLYTAGGTTIQGHYPYNIGTTAYIAVVLGNTNVVQVRVSDGAITTIGTAMYSGSTTPAFAQWQSKYLLIVSPLASKNGYWIWNGTTLFGPGTLSPTVVVTNGGRNYTTAPTVTAYGGHGSGATFTATIDTLGHVTKVDVANPGTGYTADDLVVLGFSGGGSDSSAIITPQVNTDSAGVSSVIVMNGGNNYNAGTSITFSPSGGGGVATGIVQIVNGVITGVVITNPGTGYTVPPSTALGTITVFDPGTVPGSGVQLDSQIVAGQVVGFTVNAGGTNFKGMPKVTVIGDGAGAQAHAVMTAGVVTSVVVDQPGLNYTKAVAIVEGSNAAAAAAIQIMPYGVSGATVEIYQNRVWISREVTTIFTAPSSVENFATSAGGGAFPSSESHLREQIVRLAAANGFLYVFGDSSINVISNVQTSGSPTVTTFDDSDVDTQVGAAWRDTVVSFGRALMFANSSGVYALYGGAAEKVSGPLDGLFEAASFNTGQSGVTPTASVATIFGIRVYMLLFTTTDPYSGTLRNILAMWDGQKWFVGTQSTTPSLTSLQEVDSKLTAWGSSPTLLYPLFQTKSATLSKVWQGKLRWMPGVWWGKQANRLYALVRNKDSGSASFGIALDRVDVEGDYTAGSTGSPSDGGVLTVAANGRGLQGFPVGTYGVLVGMTGTTTSKDLILVQTALVYDEKYDANV